MEGYILEGIYLSKDIIGNIIKYLDVSSQNNFLICNKSFLTGLWAPLRIDVNLILKSFSIDLHRLYFKIDNDDYDGAYHKYYIYIHNMLKGFYIRNPQLYCVVLPFKVSTENQENTFFRRSFLNSNFEVGKNDDEFYMLRKKESPKELQ